MTAPSTSRRLRPVLIAGLSLSLLMTGCFSIRTYAPYGDSVRILAPDEPAEVRRVYRTWFMLGGLITLDDTMPAEIIAREKLTEVRVIVLDTVQDAGVAIITTILLPLFILPQTIVIEGNRAPHPPVAGEHDAAESQTPASGHPR